MPSPALRKGRQDAGNRIVGLDFSVTIKRGELAAKDRKLVFASWRLSDEPEFESVGAYGAL